MVMSCERGVPPGGWGMCAESGGTPNGWLVRHTDHVPTRDRAVVP